jgi:hypothetical protein
MAHDLSQEAAGSQEVFSFKQSLEFFPDQVATCRFHRIAKTLSEAFLVPIGGVDILLCEVPITTQPGEQFHR